MSKLLPATTPSENNEAIPQQRLNISPFLRTAKRKALLIGAIATLTTGFFAYQDYQKNPVLKYAGSFQLLPEPLTLEEKSSDPSTLINSNGIPNDRLLAIDYPTMLQILRSPDMLSEIVEQVQTEYPEFNISQLNQNLKVERINDSTNRLDASKILAIGYTDKDPELVQLVLETTAQKYLDYSLNSRKQGIDKGIQFIERQLPKLNQKVSQSQDEIQELQERYQIVQADAKGESLLENIRNAESQQRETQKEIEEQTQIVNNLQSQLKISTEEAITISALRENPNYQTLAKRYKDKVSDLAIASAKFRDDSPQVISLQSEKQKILDLLNSETRQILIDEGVSQRANKLLVLDDQNSILLDLVGQLVQAANKLDTLQARQRAVTQNLNQFENQALEFPEISRKYKSLQKELQIANRTREQLSTQKDKLQIQASQTETPWTVVSQPQVAQDSRGNPQPLPTNSQSNVLKGLIGGLFLGIVSAILLEKIQGIFYSLEDVRDLAGSAAILGEIPFRNKSLAKKDSSYFQPSLLNKEIADLTEPLSYQNPLASTCDKIEFVNAFEQLYANIYLRYRDRAIRSIAVSSPSFRDGKSTVALNLAKTIAADGKQVLLVDASSSIYRLADSSQMNSQIDDNLHVFTATPDTLGNSVIRAKLMNDFSSEYEYIIYDVPSIMDSVTAGFLSISTDGILLVTATEKTKRSAFIKALEQIETLNLPLLGIVINHAGGKQLQIENHQVVLDKLLKPSKSDRSSERKVSFSALDRGIHKDRDVKSSNSH